MGAAHAKAVYGLWGHLPHAPHRLLVFMALTAKDGDDPPTFWGGRDTLAVALGRAVPLEQTDAAQRVRNASYVAVRAAVQHLVEVGAIARDRRSSPGRTSRYVLNVRLMEQADAALPRPGSGDAMEQAQPAVNNSPIEAIEQAEPALHRAGSACALEQAQPAQWSRLSLRIEQAEPALEEEQEDRGLTRGVGDSGLCSSDPARDVDEPSATVAVSAVPSRPVDLDEVCAEHSPHLRRRYCGPCRSEQLARPEAVA